MKKALLTAVVAFVCVGYAPAADPCPPPPPRMKWVEVCETVQVEVPAVTYVDEPCEVKVVRKVPTQIECEELVTQWICEEKTVPVRKKVVEREEYTVMAKKKEFRVETRTKEVWKTVVECVDEVVCKTFYDEACDPETGKMIRIARTEEVVVPKKVKKKVCEEVEYEVRVPCYVEVPVTKTRKVVKYVEDVKVVQVRKAVKVPVKKMITVMRPVEETKTVMRKRAVRTTKTVDRVIRKKIQVPCEPEPVCPPAPCAPAL